MSEASVKVQIPDDAIKSVVFAEIAKQLGNPADLVAKLVQEVLMRPVEKAQYSNTKIPLWEKQLQAQIERFAGEVVSELLADSKPQIRAVIEQKLKAKTFGGKLADALVAAVSESSWNVKLALNVGDGVTRDF